jgi:hypothetical protein
MANRRSRTALFDRLSDELASLVPNATERYCCPICLRLFERAEADQCLTLEHIIPDGLGKRLPALTCKTCNNDVGGAKLDSHLHKKLAIESFLIGSGKPVAAGLRIGGHHVAVDWERIPGEGGVKNNLRIIEKATAPSALQGSKEAMLGLSEGDELNLTFQIASERRVRMSLLKAGYLLGFRELGYRFILHQNLSVVRQQIQRPEEMLLPIDALVVDQVNPPAVNCVMQITDPENLHGILVSLELQSPGGSTLQKGVLLPTPASPCDFFERARALQQGHASAKFTGYRLQ